MAYTQVNPYLTIAQLKAELKYGTDTIYDDVFGEAIVSASRWVDQYLRRDFFYHDYRITALTLTEFDDVFERVIIPPYRPILSITALTLYGTALVANTDYIIRGNGTTVADQIVKLGSNWDLKSPDNIVTLNGEFGYRQTSTWPVTEAGDVSSQVSNWSLQNLGTSVVYWGIQTVTGTTCRVSLWSDSAHSNRIATGTGLNSSTLTLSQDNNSGVSGTVLVAYTTDDLDVANTLIPTAVTVDTSVVPTGIPGHIVHATRLVAAAFSGQNRKETVGLDGVKTSILTNEIPKTVFQILGRQAPLVP